VRCVPIVDISGHPDVVGAELDEICRTVGFFQVTGSGIPDGVAEHAWTMAARFFDLPAEDKLRVARPSADYPYGYIPLAGESLSQSMTGAGHLSPPHPPAPPDPAAPPDLKEVFNTGPPVPPAHEFADPDEAWAYSPNLWPAALPELEAAWTVYYEAMRDLGNRLMSLLARGLGLPPGFFADKTGHGANALRAINYPARDTAALTLHRVVDPPDPAAANARRQSMPYFQNADWSAKVSCLPTCLQPGETPRYEPVLAGPHLMGKFRRSLTF
jgi:isopenicillin N synthase-like dioxygenase